MRKILGKFFWYIFFAVFRLLAEPKSPLLLRVPVIIYRQFLLHFVNCGDYARQLINHAVRVAWFKKCPYMYDFDRSGLTVPTCLCCFSVRHNIRHVPQCRPRLSNSSSNHQNPPNLFVQLATSLAKTKHNVY